MRIAIAFAAHCVFLLAAPPLLIGVIQRVKAVAAGRRGAPLVQPYRDLWRLLQKGSVYSSRTSWVFRAGPLVGLVSTLLAGCLLPLTMKRAPLGFEGDPVLFACLLALGRFATICAALDTGSSFEGMGASREAAFGALAEPALLLALAALVTATHSLSLGGVVQELAAARAANPAVLLAVGSLFGVVLAENARVPIDDPATHLELTMVHEVMVLDHSGPDLAIIELSAAMKLFVTAALLAAVAVPATAGKPLGALGGAVGVAVAIGVLESTMARLRLPRVKQFLIGSGALGVLALVAAVLVRGPR